MSLLEDIFLQDEADEAQQLERVIESDEYGERPRSRSATPDSDENVNRDDEAEEDKRRVDPSSTKAKRVTKNPRFILNPARLTGPRGIQILPDHFKDFKFKGKGHEKEDLDMVLKKLEHWAYRLYPKFQFEDCLKKIETLGKKRPVMVQLQKIRSDQFVSEEDTVVQKDSSDEETQPQPLQEEDEFDKLLQQQIEIARATPAPGSVKKVIDDTPRQDRSPFTMPKATSSPSISDEQKERMIRNRKLAEERRLARLKEKSMDTSDKQENTNNISEIVEVDEDNVEANVTTKKHNRSHVIDSSDSDDDCDISSVNQAVTVVVHKSAIIDEVNDLNSINKIGLDDVEMYENIDNNDAGEVDQEVIEITDDVDKGIGKNGKINDRIGKVDTEIIEIHDQVDKSDNIKIDRDVVQINDRIDKVADEIIEIKDQTDKGVDEIIEINDHSDKVTDKNVRESRIIDTEILKDNCDTLTIDITNDFSSQSPNVEAYSDHNISTENQSNTNNVSVQNENTDKVEQNITEEKPTNQSKDPVLKDSESNKNKDDNLKQNDANMADEFTEDIMDVDFSDDF